MLSMTLLQIPIRKFTDMSVHFRTIMNNFLSLLVLRFGTYQENHPLNIGTTLLSSVQKIKISKFKWVDSKVLRYTSSIVLLAVLKNLQSLYSKPLAISQKSI